MTKNQCDNLLPNKTKYQAKKLKLYVTGGV